MRYPFDIEIANQAAAALGMSIDSDGFLIHSTDLNSNEAEDAYTREYEKLYKKMALHTY